MQQERVEDKCIQILDGEPEVTRLARPRPKREENTENGLKGIR